MICRRCDHSNMPGANKCLGCGAYLWKQAKQINLAAIHARTTVGAAFERAWGGGIEPPTFVAPDALSERIVEGVATMLRTRLDPLAAEERARNVVQWLITEFDVRERK